MFKNHDSSDCSGPRKKLPNLAPNGARMISSLYIYKYIPDLADILDDTDFDFENLYFFDSLGCMQLGPSPSLYIYIVLPCSWN